MPNCVTVTVVHCLPSIEFICHHPDRSTDTPTMHTSLICLLRWSFHHQEAAELLSQSANQRYRCMKWRLLMFTRTVLSCRSIQTQWRGQHASHRHCHRAVLTMITGYRFDALNHAHTFDIDLNVFIFMLNMLSHTVDTVPFTIPQRERINERPKKPISISHPLIDVHVLVHS